MNWFEMDDPMGFYGGGSQDDSLSADPSSVNLPGAFTGFGTYLTDPETGGVVDTRGAFNPAFNGRTSKPMFEAETDALRQVLPGLAAKVQKGDAGAAANYDTIYRTYRERKHVYDLASATGLNDRNSTFIMNHSFDVASPQAFGAEASAFRNRYARYLSGITKDRDTNAEKLVESDHRLDRAFAESFLSSLETAGDVFRPSSSLRSVYSGNSGALAAESLQVKEALASWEKANGFRTDAERETIMSAAARYYAKCKANPGLRSLASDPSAIIAAAARSVGASGTADGRDVFRDYDDAIATLDRRISYTGSAAEDLARGLGAGDGSKTLAFAAIKDAYQQAYARNLVAGKGTDDGSLRDDAALKARLVSNLRRVVPLATVDPASRDAMLSDFADNVMMQMADTGSVNLSKATMMYHSGDLAEVAKYTPPSLAISDAAMQGLQATADNLVTEMLQNRDTFNFSVSSALSAPFDFLSPSIRIGKSPYYDETVLRNTVSSQFDKLAATNPAVAELSKSDPELLGKFKSKFSDFIVNASLKADRWSIKGNIDTEDGEHGYRTAAKDLLRALAVGAEARRFFDLGDWEPKIGEVDVQLRGRGRDNFRAFYNDLASRIEKQIPLDPKTDDEYYRMQVGQKLVDNIRRLTDQTVANANDEKVLPFVRSNAASGATARDALADGFMSATFSDAASAMGLRYAEAVKRATAPDPNVSDGQVAALRELSEGIFSDQLNPSLVRNLRAYAVNKLGTMAGLSKDQRAWYVDAYLPGLVTLAKLAFRDSPDGIGMYSTDKLALARLLDSRSKALFQDAQAQSDLILQMQLAEREKRLQMAQAVREG